MPIAPSVRLGRDVVIHHPDLVNLYGCEIGDGTKIGAFVEIQKNASIGRLCKISSHTFVCEGVSIEDDVFVGHGVMFINDRYPRATGGRPADGSRLEGRADARPERARRSAAAPSSCAASRSAPARSSAPAPSSRTTCPTMRWSRACRRACARRRHDDYASA